MAHCAVQTLKDSIASLNDDSPELAQAIRDGEEKTDHYEDILGSYLVKLSTLQIGESQSAEAAMLLKSIGDFERISDHGVSILESAEELRSKGLSFSGKAVTEISTISNAINEILDLSLKAFEENDLNAAVSVEPLEQVIDDLKEKMRTNHIARLQQGGCTIDAGFVWADLLTNFSRTSDHCSNVAGSIIDLSLHNMNIHETLRSIRSDNDDFKQKFSDYRQKYAI